MSQYDYLAEEDVDLSQFDEAFASAPVAGGDAHRTEIPDGYYETVVEDAVLTRTQRTGKPILTWRLRIQSGDHSGQTLVKNRVITEKTLGFLKEDLQRCGVEVSRLSELQSRLHEMRNRAMRVMKRTRDGWVDVYFLRSSNAAAPELDDNLPF